MLKPTTRRQALRDAAKPTTPTAQDGGQIVRGRLAFHVRAKRKDHFYFLGGRLDPAYQRLDPEILRRHSVKWRELATETMVTTTKCAGALQGQHVGGLFDDAKHVLVAFRIIADAAAGIGGEKAADWARAYGFLGGLQYSGERQRVGFRALQEPDGDALGTARADAGQALEFADQVADGFWKISRSHGEIVKFSFAGMRWRME